MGLLGLNKAFLVREPDGHAVEIQETYVQEELWVEAWSKPAIRNQALDAWTLIGCPPVFREGDERVEGR